MHAERACEFPGDLQTPGAARSFALSALAELVPVPIADHICDDLALVVSELVTNAIRAGAASIAVTIGVTRTRIAIRVSDRAAGWPEQRTAGVHDVTGRGLPLVSAVSAAWGVQREPAGKTVWAELELRTADTY